MALGRVSCIVHSMGLLKQIWNSASHFLVFHFQVWTQIFFPGFKPEMHFKFLFHFLLISQQLLIVFPTRLSSQTQDFELFSQLIIAIWLSNLELGSFFLGFKTHVFNFQFLTQTDISFSRFPNFRPKKGHFLVYFNRPNFC